VRSCLQYMYICVEVRVKVKGIELSRVRNSLHAKPRCRSPEKPTSLELESVHMLRYLSINTNLSVCDTTSFPLKRPYYITRTEHATLTLTMITQKPTTPSPQFLLPPPPQ
jgi:hypothetical protein